MANDRVDTAIAANIEAMGSLLREAAARADEAVTYLDTGQRNAAIGTVIDLGRDLADATALLGAALALHRQQGRSGLPRRMPESIGLDLAPEQSGHGR
jgi:hypothetical protein